MYEAGSIALHPHALCFVWPDAGPAAISRGMSALRPIAYGHEQTRSVADTYDANTYAFVNRGHGRNTGAIHRAVWGNGVKTRDEAMHHVEERLLRRWHELTPASHTAGSELYFVDLGCGICGSLCFLHHRARELAMPNVSGTGVTISAVQVEMAERYIRDQGLTGQIRCLLGDFCALPEGLRRGADVAFAIESFVHGPDPLRFLQQAASVLKPGGLLMVCDDLLGMPLAELPGAARPYIDRFKQGWRTASLVTEPELIAMARGAGFRHLETWHMSGELELGRLRDYAIRLLVSALGWLPLRSSYFGMLKGGDALQTALKRGWLEYKAVLLTKGHGSAPTPQLRVAATATSG